MFSFFVVSLAQNINNFNTFLDVLMTLGCVENSCPLYNLPMNANCSYDKTLFQCSSTGDIVLLALANSGLNGTLDNIANLTKLQYVDLSKNSLSSTIPDMFSSLSNLTYFSVIGNRLTGTLPPSLSMAPLSQFFVHGNNMYGFVTSVTALGEIPDGNCVLQNTDFVGNCFNLSSPACEYCQCQSAAARCGGGSSSSTGGLSTTVGSTSTTGSISREQPLTPTTTTDTELLMTSVGLPHSEPVSTMTPEFSTGVIIVFVLLGLGLIIAIALIIRVNIQLSQVKAQVQRDVEMHSAIDVPSSAARASAAVVAESVASHGYSRAPPPPAVYDRVIDPLV